MLVLVAAFTPEWLGSKPRFPVPASLYLLALQLKPSLSDLRAPERPLFTHPPPFGFNPDDVMGVQGISVLTTLPFVGPFEG